ncbi:putative dihydrokaempferol 4-reductase (NAD-dependent epimerase/dehydratase) [Scheffersomyces coipomensis]|uniref:putative dihydrokaempferol 4-reductase (NAD-dependent epimerase/dehydratase) n=1 Tax=Scheffersomyces coipomensis TaxID=1788519 RepID=UPI00315C7672
MTETVLVTGGTGFIGATILIQLLEAGNYQVRTTVRSISKADFIYSLIKKNIANITDEQIKQRLEIFEADLTSDKGWEQAITGVDYVLHVASPVIEPKDENEAIIPARDGTLRVTKLSHKYGAKKIIFTSSFATVGYGHLKYKSIYDENDFSPLETTIGAYPKSKIEAERVFWEYIRSDKNTKSSHPIIGTALLPVAVLGPPPKGLSARSSIELGVRLVNGGFKYGVPKLLLGVIDSRDVAKLHIDAIHNKASEGERIILVDQKEKVDFLQITEFVRHVPGVNQSNLPTRFLPSWLFKLLAIFVHQIKGLVPLLDVQFDIDNTKSLKIFKDWTPIPVEQTFKDMTKRILENEA